MSSAAAATPSTGHELSRLQVERQSFVVPLPSVLRSGATSLRVGSVLSPPSDKEAIAALFPHTFGAPSVHIEAATDGGASSAAAAAARPLRVGAVLSGGQAPGGHNVLSGIYDGIKRQHPDSVFLGFLDGPRGLFEGKYVEIDDAMMYRYRNMGGFDAIGSGRDKIETPEQFAGARAWVEKLALDGVVIIGGDDSNTNGAVLAEYFKANGCTTRVVGAPKTIDGDLKIPGYVDVSFGFDTACRTYSELIGNVCVDALSSQKYWHFVRLMGRAASNITLECALATHPNLTLIGEEVAARHQNLASITQEIVTIVQERAAGRRNYGVVLIPEGLIEFVPEVSHLLSEINELLAAGTPGTVPAVTAALSPASAALFTYLPDTIKRQLLADRDPHGNVQVSLIETEKLLAELVQFELDKLAAAGQCPLPLTKDGKWPTAFQYHFFGYEGRCALPCDFDSSYCYALGVCAATLVSKGCTGVMSSVTELHRPVAEWACSGTPLTAFFNIERRHGKNKPVIKKALVELDCLPYQRFAALRHAWSVRDAFRNPGPIQLQGSGHTVELCHTLALEYQQQREGGSAGAAAQPAAGATGEAAKAGYAALLKELLAAAPPSVEHVNRALFFRLAYKVTDAMHSEVLAEVGAAEQAFKAVQSAVRASAAAAAEAGKV